VIVTRCVAIRAPTVAIGGPPRRSVRPMEDIVAATLVYESATILDTFDLYR
jgi:hypothetical protein